MNLTAKERVVKVEDIAVRLIHKYIYVISAQEHRVGNYQF